MEHSSSTSPELVPSARSIVLFVQSAFSSGIDRGFVSSPSKCADGPPIGFQVYIIQLFPILETNSLLA